MTLFASVLETEGFTIGQDNSRSGLFRQEAASKWTSLGWPNVRNFGIATTPDFIFLACGNGVLRSADNGRNWRMTTDWKITEVLDVALDPTDPHKLVIATAHGIAWSPDDGDTWQTNNQGLTSTFVHSIVFEPAASGVRSPEFGEGTLQSRWIAGTEDGLFATPDPTAEWMRVGLAGLAIRRIAVNSEGVCAVAADGAGVWLRNGGDWTPASQLPTDASFYAAAVSDDGQSIATGGFQSGVFLSRDGGASWTHLADGLTNLNIQALSFRPETDELWAGTSGGGAFRLDGSHWVFEGLPGSTIRKFYFDRNR
ncbi:MAG TPA: hypothetical protein VMO47_18620 [Rhodothermales bacterium]|nr:hypothetical protein [Rhodothermales bacterium]